MNPVLPDSAFVQSVQGPAIGLASQISYTVVCNYSNRVVTISGVVPANKRPNGTRGDLDIVAASPGDPVYVQAAGNQLRFFVFESLDFADCDGGVG